ncbi:sodium/potassium/calcium exchanger 5 isoform X1 [Aedes aegypti]|uniref:Sodium/potassium/calcium exchanger 5 n=1 Tax=Aedes aegypti TaxID=7159 RepID=A0A6I8TA99_AEDAE|nr:sodium/potassium/calcium exchanger 5 isoform X1 [Aedes aegypti]
MGDSDWGLERLTNGLNCTPPAIEDFPPDLFTVQQRQNGAIVLHALASLYLFVALAVVCDKYFVPAVEKICHALNMSNDVAGATFMAAATSAPELFVNVIGTFITEGDIGVGTIVGSAVFNILAVAACCGIGAGMVVPLDWWPLTRDCLAYGITVAILICIIHDERVEWYEALILVLLYIVYIAVMYYDKAFQKCARDGLKHARTRRSQDASSSLKSVSSKDQEAIDAHLPLRISHFQQNGNLKNVTHIDASSPELTSSNLEMQIKAISGGGGTVPAPVAALAAATVLIGDQHQQQGQHKQQQIKRRHSAGSMNGTASLDEDDQRPPPPSPSTPPVSSASAESMKNSLNGDHSEKDAGALGNGATGGESADVSDDKDEEFQLFKYPSGQSKLRQFSWIITWPIYLLFVFTIPNCAKPRYKKWFPLTFIMCIVWIGSLSYVVAWMITIIGDTLKIPDSVMGITFLAAGTSVPEAVSSVIVAKQGYGSMGISNSIGSNTFDILLCLGLPWFIKAAFSPIEKGHHWVGINSAGLEYSAISLLSTLLMLYIAFWLNKFRLDRRVGYACLIMYAVFLILASLIELNVFFPVNLPTCVR